MRSRSQTLARKSVDAMVAAIEAYNKPSFSYREETFSILAINAWELLLKARILQLSGNKVSSVLKYEKRRNANGQMSAKLYRVKNRSGTHLSIGMFKALDLLEHEYGDSMPTEVRKNLELLCEIRDNSIHFVNKGFDLALLVQQLGTACLKNYLVAVRRLFGIDLSDYNFFLMPLAFYGSDAGLEGVPLNSEEKKLSAYLRTETQAPEPDSEPGYYNVSLNINVKFTKSKTEDSELVRITNDPDATPITISEEDVREKYPWDYKILTTRLGKRYSDFKLNKKYHDIRKPLESNEIFCNKRYLDPAVRTGIGKCFYSPNIIKEFDSHYTKKS